MMNVAASDDNAQSFEDYLNKLEQLEQEPDSECATVRDRRHIERDEKKRLTEQKTRMLKTIKDLMENREKVAMSASEKAEFEAQITGLKARLGEAEQKHEELQNRNIRLQKQVSDLYIEVDDERYKTYKAHRVRWRQERKIASLRAAAQRELPQAQPQHPPHPSHPPAAMPNQLHHHNIIYHYHPYAPHPGHPHMHSQPNWYVVAVPPPGPDEAPQPHYRWHNGYWIPINAVVIDQHPAPIVEAPASPALSIASSNSSVQVGNGPEDPAPVSPAPSA